MNSSISNKARIGLIISAIYGMSLFIGFKIWELTLGIDRVGDYWIHTALFFLTSLLIIFLSTLLNRYVGIVVGIVSLIISFVINYDSHSKEKIFERYALINSEDYNLKIYNAKYFGGIDFAVYLIFEFDESAFQEILIKNKLIKSDKELQMGSGVYSVDWWNPELLKKPVEFYSNNDYNYQICLAHDNNQVYLFVFKI